MLEKLQQLLSPFLWPRTLTLKLEGCDGEVDAWYENATVTVCYEYLDDVWRNAPKKPARWGLAPIDAVVGPLYDVFLHESAHALFDLLQVPLLGGEEDAADQVSAFIMLQLGKEEARRLILGTAYAYSVEFKPSIVPYVFIGLGLLLIAVGALSARLWMIGSGAAIAVAVALYLTVTSTYGSTPAIRRRARHAGPALLQSSVHRLWRRSEPVRRPGGEAIFAEQASGRLRRRIPAGRGGLQDFDRSAYGPRDRENGD